MRMPALYNRLGDRSGEASAVRGLGDLERGLGRNEQARTAYEDARILYQQLGDRSGEADVLRGLADLERRLSRDEQE